MFGAVVDQPEAFNGDFVILGRMSLSSMPITASPCVAGQLLEERTVRPPWRHAGRLVTPLLIFKPLRPHRAGIGTGRSARPANSPDAGVALYELTRRPDLVGRRGLMSVLRPPIRVPAVDI